MNPEAARFPMAIKESNDNQRTGKKKVDQSSTLRPTFMGGKP